MCSPLCESKSWALLALQKKQLEVADCAATFVDDLYKRAIEQAKSVGQLSGDMRAQVIMQYVNACIKAAELQK